MYHFNTIILKSNFLIQTQISLNSSNFISISKHYLQSLQISLPLNFCLSNFISSFQILYFYLYNFKYKLK